MSDLQKINDQLEAIQSQLDNALGQIGTALIKLKEAIRDLDVPMENDPCDQVSAFLASISNLQVETPIIEAAYPFTVSTLSDAFALVERHTQRVSLVLMNPHDYNNLRKVGGDMLDVVSKVSVLRKGVFAYLWGAYVVPRTEIPIGTIYAIGEANEELGETSKVAQIRVSNDAPKITQIKAS